MRIVGRPVEPGDLQDDMEAKRDGNASADAAGRERLRFRVVRSNTGEHIGTYIGLKDGNLDGAFWMQVSPQKRGL